MLFFVNWLGVFTVRNERVTALFFPSKDKKKQVVIPLSLHRLFLEPPNRSPIALRERKRKGKIAAAAGRSAMPDTGAKRKSREGGVREGDGEGDAFAEVQAWLDTVPLISVAPPKQVRAG